MDCILGVTQSLSGRAWRPREGDARSGLALSQRFGFPEIVGRLLACRGVAEEECERFLAPTLRDGLPDPSHLKDMDRAVEILLEELAQDPEAQVRQPARAPKRKRSGGNSNTKR